MASPSWKKLNLKDHRAVVVLDAPKSFEAEIAALAGVGANTNVRRAVGEADVDFAIAFALTQEQVNVAAEAVAAHLLGDGIIWIAYPKGSSKRYRCEFNRDSGWTRLGELGFEPVRQVAVDEDWSALRFRRVEFIKTMTRSFALTDEGKKKAGTEG